MSAKDLTKRIGNREQISRMQPNAAVFQLFAEWGYTWWFEVLLISSNALKSELELSESITLLRRCSIFTKACGITSTVIFWIWNLFWSWPGRASSLVKIFFVKFFNCSEMIVSFSTRCSARFDSFLVCANFASCSSISLYNSLFPCPDTPEIWMSAKRSLSSCQEFFDNAVYIAVSCCSFNLRRRENTFKHNILQRHNVWFKRCATSSGITNLLESCLQRPGLVFMSFESRWQQIAV